MSENNVSGRSRQETPGVKGNQQFATERLGEAVLSRPLGDTGDYQSDVKRAVEAATAYYNTGVETMTDYEYDRLLEQVASFENNFPDQTIDHELFTAVSAGTSDGGDVQHLKPMLSLDKAQETDEVRKFLSAAKAVGGTVKVEPKLDGLAISVTYRDGKYSAAARRGNGQSGEDVTEKLRALTVTGLEMEIDYKKTILIRGELIMSASDFEVSNAARQESGKPAFANPRNAAAGTLSRDTVSYNAQMTFVAYDVVPGGDEELADTHTGRLALAADLGFTTMTQIMPDLGSDVLTAVNDFNDARRGDDFPFPTDGIVLTIDEDAARAALGTGSRAPKFAIAYKYDAETAETTVLKIETAVGRTGAISFTAILEPVEIDGSVVGRATLNNPTWIAEKDVRVGSKVLVRKANDIIPEIVEVLSQPEGSRSYEADTTCPISGEPLDMSQVIWRSTSPEASIGALVHYSMSRDVFDVDGLGTELSDALVDRGLINDIGDLFSLTENQLATLQLGSDRVVGQKTAAKIIAGIEKAKEQPLNRVITSLGIRKSGRTFGRRLAARYETMDALLNATEEGFLRSGVEGIGPERARFFYEGFQKNRVVIEKMRAAGVNMGSVAPAASTSADTSAKPLAGMSVVVSGSIPGYNRTEANELIEKLGGKSSGSVSASTTMLVTSDTSSSKSVKALALGVEIVDPTAFLARVGLV
jgi:DNA ligase (NAD+)